jgi:hypothetical protein
VTDGKGRREGGELMRGSKGQGEKEKKKAEEKANCRPLHNVWVDGITTLHPTSRGNHYVLTF